MNCPKISVIVPVYNVENYLEKCLDSIINQTFSDIEIICVNDGSTDKSLQILNKYQSLDERIKVVSKENDGLGPARNTGIENAKANLYCFIDSDDYFCKNALEELYNAYIKTKADIIVAKAVLFEDKTNKIIYSRGWNNLIKPKKDIFNGRDCSGNLYQLVNQMTHAKLFSKSVIEKYNLKFHKCRMHEDLTFTLTYLSLCNSIYLLDKEIYMYRTAREGSLVFQNRGKSDSWKDFDIAFEKLKQNLIKNGCYDIYTSTFDSALIMIILGHFKNISYINKFKLIKFVREKYRYLLEPNKNLMLNKKYYLLFRLIFGWRI